MGIYFITQNPQDIPDGVLGQLGNKVQHALRAYTPKEQKAAKAAAESFRVNPDFDTLEVLTALGTGEALISVLDEKGVPTVVKQCDILPPQSMMGPIDDTERNNQVTNGMLYPKYSQVLDRESAYEMLSKKVEQEEIEEQQAAEAEAAAKQQAKEEAAAAKKKEKEAEAARKAEEKAKAAKEKKKQSEMKKVASSATSTIGREVGNTIGNAIGGKFGKKLGGNIGAALGRGILSTLFKN